MDNTFKISSSPHVRDKRSTQSIMLDVIIALLPATVFGIINFELNAMILILTCVVSCVLFEWLYQKMMNRKVTISDLSAVVTGLLLALNLSPDVPVWMAILGSAFAIIIVKQLFGGLGFNFMNPALGARCFLLISFAGRMTSFSYDGVTTATPLAVLKNTGDLANVNVLNMFLGNIPGTIGETSVVCLLVGAAYLLIRRVIKPVIPFTYIGTFAVLIMIYAEFPDRAFDVGIAEEHAVTFAAGLATSGLVPVVAIYSSFLQRAYDQILHDVCLQKLHVIFAIDRSGLVGADGDTHQGIFDTAFLSHIPNMTIIAPKNRYELTRAMEWAVAYDGPVALKYSRGEAYYGLKEYNVDIEYGRSEMIHRGQKLAIVAVGNMVQEAEKVYDRLLADGTNVTFVNARFLKPIDTDMIDELSRDHEHIVVIEEEIKHGGYGSLVEEYVMDRHLDVDVTVCAIEDTFVQHGSVEELRRMLKLDADSLYDRIKHIISTDCTE